VGQDRKLSPYTGRGDPSRESGPESFLSSFDVEQLLAGADYYSVHREVNALCPERTPPLSCLLAERLLPTIAQRRMAVSAIWLGRSGICVQRTVPVAFFYGINKPQIPARTSKRLLYTSLNDLCFCLLVATCAHKVLPRAQHPTVTHDRSRMQRESDGRAMQGSRPILSRAAAKRGSVEAYGIALQLFC